MTNKEKRELKDGIISIFKRFNILDHTATIGVLRDDILKFINSLQEEPVSESPNIESMIESYKKRLISQANGVKNSPLIDMCLASYKHGVNETLETLNLSNAQRTGKIWKEPVSEDLEKVVEEIVDPTVLNAYGVKEIANRLRRTMTGSVNDAQVKESFISKHENKTCKVNGNSLTQEPVNDDLEAELDKYIKDNFTIDKEQLDKFGIEEKDYMYSMDKSDMEKMVRYFTGNYKIPVSDGLEEAAKLYVSDSLCITSEEDWDDAAIEALNAYKAGAKW